jgi:SAM-dependent methyltransferase
MCPDLADSAKVAYDAFAGAYDDFTHAYRNDRWTGRIEAKARTLGLEGDRLLDVGCGTGKSFIPMMNRGWEVTACDIAPPMVDLARAKVGGRANVVVADMRELPALGEFDLVWALDDAMNYLLSAGELRSTLCGMRQNLGPNGILAFDMNTLLTYRTFFCTEHVVEVRGRRMVWRGKMSPQEVESGCISEATFETDAEAVPRHTHRQRHFGEAEVLRALGQANLSCRAIVGDLDGELADVADEAIHTKAIYFCVRS